MKVYLISNNLVVEDISYISNEVLEQKRLTRPLSIEGEKIAARLGQELSVGAIYSSFYSSAVSTSKYIAQYNNVTIKIDSELNDSKIGNLGKHNIKMLRFMQERNFDFKYPNGESLNETSTRLNKAFKKIIHHETEDVAIITHKRAMIGLLSNYCDQGFNLDDRLILSYNDKVLLDDSENDIDIIVIEITDGKIKNIDNY